MTKTGRPVGKPPYKPQDKDRPVVQALVANGLTHPQIAHYLKIDRETLEKYFREELDRGMDTVLAIISGRLVQKAMAGDNTCMIFWLKTRHPALFNPPTRAEVTGANGRPLYFGNTPDDRLSKIIAAIRTSLPPDDGDGGGSQAGD